MIEIPIWEKSNLTLEEAAAYSGIGINKLREITNEPGCNFVLFVGTKHGLETPKKEKHEEFSKFKPCITPI